MNALETLAAVVTQAPAVAEAPAVKAKPQKAAKPADKPAEGKGKGVNTKQAKQAAPAVPYFIKDGYRPAAGRALKEFTHAWLSLSGMASGKAYPTAQARKVAGSSAIAYHKGAGRFEETNGTLKLTKAGQAFFAERANANSEEAVKAFVSIMRTGKPDGKFVKAADLIGKIEA